MIINISTNLSFTMSIDNGHYKQFGGIDDLYMIKDFQTGDIYTNTVSAKTYRVNDLVWDVSSGGNRITNVLDGNIIIGGEISGNLAPGAGENIVFKSDKQYWNAFTDLNNIGRIINRNTSATDISGITLSEPATAYLYDGMVEISGVLISGHLHINSDNSRNLVFIQGISNEIQGTESSRYHHVEGENNVVLQGTTQYSHVEGYGNKISGDFIQCEGSGNVIYGDFSHAEGEKNRIDISGTGNFCFVEGYDCSVSGVSEFSKAEGYKSSVVNSNYSLAYGREGTVKNSYGSIVGGIKADIDGGGSNDNGGFRLITELNQGDPINNPWTGTGEAGSPDVLIPLNTLSNNNGQDLEIKMEWDNNLVKKIRVEVNLADWGDYETNTNNLYYGANPGGRAVNIAEIKVFNQEGVNVATGATSQSSDGGDGTLLGHQYGPSNLVIDGNSNTFNNTATGNDGWLEVELSSLSVVSSIEIRNRFEYNARVGAHVNQIARVPTRIKLLDASDNVLKTIVPTSWSTDQQTFTFTEQEQQNDFTSTSTRYFKGWPLNIVFDYTITTSSLNYTVSSRKTLEEDWITRTQNIYKDGDNRWNWSFNSGMGSLTLGTNDGFGWKNYGFLLMGNIDPNKETAFFLFAGTDQHKPFAAYEYAVVWSKVRVYAKLTSYNYIENIGIDNGAFRLITELNQGDKTNNPWTGQANNVINGISTPNGDETIVFNKPFEAQYIKLTVVSGARVLRWDVILDETNQISGTPDNSSWDDVMYNQPESQLPNNLPGRWSGAYRVAGGTYDVHDVIYNGEIGGNGGRFLANGTPAQTIGLLSKKMIKGVRIQARGGMGSQYVETFTIEHSNDNTNWTKIEAPDAPRVLIPLNTLSNNNGEDLEIKMEWDNNLVSKIRIENNRSESGHNQYATVQLADIKVFDENGTNQISPTSTITQSDNSNGDDAYKAIDGNLNTENSNGVNVFSSGKWVEVTLNTPSRVSRVVITNHAGHTSTSAPHGVPTRIKFIDSNNDQIETFGINEWPTVEQTFTYNPHIGGGTSTRFYKGWRLDYVFDYTLADDDVAVVLPTSPITVYAKWDEDDVWYSYSQQIQHYSNREAWSFHQGAGTELSNIEPMSGYIGYQNVGLSIDSPNYDERLTKIYSGQDENRNSKYNGLETWSKLRVYAKVNAYNYVEGSGNQINNASGAFVAGMGNRSQSSYSTVLGEYNEAINNVIFSIGHGTGDAVNQRKDALVIRTSNMQTGPGRAEGFRDISVNVGMSATDISVGWWVADTVHENPCFTVSISDDAIWIDGSRNGTVELDRYKTYKFLQDGSSNIGEPFIIVATQDNSSTVLVPHQGFTATGTAGVDRKCLLNVNDLNIANSTLYYMSNNNTITGGEIKIKDNIYENGKISVAKTTNTGTLTTNVYSNGKQVDTEVNSIIHTTDISCSQDVSAVSHYTNGVLDYNSGFLFGSSERLTNADKWITSNKIQYLGSSKSQIFSATFDGTNFMDISSGLISDLDSSSHSFSVWVKLTNTDLYSKILGSFGDTSGGFFLYHRGINNNFGYQVSNSNYTYAVSQPVALNTWYHIVGTYDSTSGAIKLYLNGVNNSLIYNAGTGYSPAVDKYRFSFGTSSESSTWSPIWQRLHGNLYDFRYFNRVMSDAEITTLYNNPAVVGDEVLRLPLSDPNVILNGISGTYSSFTIDDIDGSANVPSTEILFSDSAADLDLYNRLVPPGITEYDISYVYNIDASLVDISGAGFQMRAKKTMLIETNQHELVVSDASVCDVINVLPIDNGGGVDLYLPVPYYGIGTKYSVQFPPAGTLVSPDTSFNYNRVIFDMNGGGFSTADAIVSKDTGFAVHFVYTTETDGLIWKSRLRAYDATV